MTYGGPTLAGEMGQRIREMHEQIKGVKPTASATDRVMESATSIRESVSTLESFNPATGELVGSVETITPGKVQGVVDDVAEVQPFWAQLSLADRARYMRRAADVLLDELDEIAELLTREQGKPRVEAYTMELLPTVDALHWMRRGGPEDPRRRAGPDAARPSQDQAVASSPTSRSASSA